MCFCTAARRQKYPGLIGMAIGLVSLIGQSSPGAAQDLQSKSPWPAASLVAPDAPRAETRCSSLSEITPDNASALRLAFSFRTGSPRGHAGAPQFVKSTLLVLTPFPHTLFALDLNPASMGCVKWSYRPR